LAEAEQAKAKRLLEKEAMRLEDRAKAKKRPLEKEADTKFLSRVDELKAFKEMHGHLKVRYEEDTSLYRFCYNVRSSGRAIIDGEGRIMYRLDDDRIAALDAIGFDWKLSAVDLMKADSEAKAKADSSALAAQVQAATTATTNIVSTSPVVAPPGSSSSTDGVAAASATLAPFLPLLPLMNSSVMAGVPPALLETLLSGPRKHCKRKLEDSEPAEKKQDAKHYHITMDKPPTNLIEVIHGAELMMRQGLVVPTVTIVVAPGPLGLDITGQPEGGARIVQSNRTAHFATRSQSVI
jgi:hypothetical protein